MQYLLSTKNLHLLTRDRIGRDAMCRLIFILEPVPALKPRKIRGSDDYFTNIVSLSWTISNTKFFELLFSTCYLELDLKQALIRRSADISSVLAVHTRFCYV